MSVFENETCTQGVMTFQSPHTDVITLCHDSSSGYKYNLNFSYFNYTDYIILQKYTQHELTISPIRPI